MDMIAAQHRVHPHVPGLALEVFRTKLAPKAQSQIVLQLLEADLCASGFIQVQAYIARKTHEPALPPLLLS